MWSWWPVLADWIKSDGGDLDIGKVKTAPLNLSKLSDVVKNEVLKNQNITRHG